MFYYEVAIKVNQLIGRKINEPACVIFVLSHCQARNAQESTQIRRITRAFATHIHQASILMKKQTKF